MSILAVGAWLKNRACLMSNDQVVWSSTHGNLSEPQACKDLDASLEMLINTARESGNSISAIAHDLHPDFYSTHKARQLAGYLDVPAVGVQHHHAHIASTIAEHHLSEPALGLALDGMGYGDNGELWGGELLLLSGASSKRLGHLSPLLMPGGDRATREPWRMAASALYSMGRGREIDVRWSSLVGRELTGPLVKMLEVKLNCPNTSSAGRWFDAAAAALGLCLFQDHEAQAAVRLEAAARAALSEFLPIEPSHTCKIIQNELMLNLDLFPLWSALLDVPKDQVNVAAAQFHLGLVDGLVRWVQAASSQTSIKVVCIGGGCFFNAILRRHLSQQLQALDFRVYQPTIEFGDAGLALGQAWVAKQLLQ